MSLPITAQFAHLILNSQPDETALSAARRGVKDYFACALPIARGALSDAGLAAIGTTFPPNGSENRALRYGYMSATRWTSMITILRCVAIRAP